MRGKGSWGRPARSSYRSLPGGGSGWRRGRCASLGRRLHRGRQRGLSRKVPARSLRCGARRRRLRSAPPQVAAHEAGPLRTSALSARPARLRYPGGRRGLAAGPRRSRSVALPLRRPLATGSFLQPVGPKTNSVRRVPQRVSLRLLGPTGGTGRAPLPPYLARSRRHSAWSPSRCEPRRRGRAGRGQGRGQGQAARAPADPAHVPCAR